MKKSLFLLIRVLVGLMFLHSFFSCDRYTPGESITKQYMKAKELYLSGDFISAESILIPVIARDKRFYQAQFLLAKCRFYKGDYQGSEKVLRRLVKKYPQYTDAQIWLGRVFFTTGNIEDAEKLLRQTLSWNSDDPRILYLLGQISEEKGDLNSAIDFYKRAGLYGEELALNHIALGRIYRKFAQNDKAVISLERALALLEEDSPMRRPLENIIKDVVEVKE